MLSKLCPSFWAGIRSKTTAALFTMHVPQPHLQETWMTFQIHMCKAYWHLPKGETCPQALPGRKKLNFPWEEGSQCSFLIREVALSNWCQIEHPHSNVHDRLGGGKSGWKLFGRIWQSSRIRMRTRWEAGHSYRCWCWSDVLQGLLSSLLGPGTTRRRMEIHPYIDIGCRPQLTCGLSSVLGPSPTFCSCHRFDSSDIITSWNF